MEREVIERLAMDRAGCELSEDGVKLLEWYLESHPEAKGWAAEMEAMYAMCAETVAGDGRICQQPLVTEQSRWAVPTLQKAFRWIAVIILALAAGIVWGRWSVESLEVGATETIRVVQEEPKEGLESKVKKMIEGDQEASESESGFWEAKIVATLGAKPRVKREEPVQAVGFWSNIRGQHRKDNYNE